MVQAIKARMIGMAALALGVALAWYSALDPLRKAMAGAARVNYDQRIFLLTPMLLVAGLFLMAGGSPVVEAFRKPPRTRQDHAIVWSAFILAFAAGTCAWLWMDSQLAALGYRTP